MFRCFDSETNSVATDFENRNLDIVGNDDLLIFLTTDDQHETLSLKPPDQMSLVLPKENVSLDKNTES